MQENFTTTPSGAAKLERLTDEWGASKSEVIDYLIYRAKIGENVTEDLKNFLAKRFTELREWRADQAKESGE